MSPPKIAPHWRTDLETLKKSSASLFSKGTVPRGKISNGYTTSAGALCHGRVHDLESMVPAQWWQTVFADAMYLKTDGDVVEDPEITKEEVGLLESDQGIKGILLRGSNSGDQGAVLASNFSFLTVSCNQI